PRVVHVAHGLQRHAHEQPQALPLGLDEGPDHHVGRDVVRPGARGQRQRERRGKAVDKDFPGVEHSGQRELTTKKGEWMISKPRKRNLLVGSAFAGVLAALAACQALLQNIAGTPGATVLAPMYEVDPLWPKPLPNHWLLGMTIGVWADDDDHIWI